MRYFLIIWLTFFSFLLSSVFKTYSQKCEIPKPRVNPSAYIVNGFISPNFKHPYVTAIGAFFNRDLILTCTGVIVTPSDVLTAAHCAKTFIPAFAIVGSTDLYSNNPDHFTPICTIIYHNEFNLTGQTEHDLAVLKLCSKLSLSIAVMPICLTPLEINYDIALLAGFGRLSSDLRDMSRHLREVVLQCLDFLCVLHYTTFNISLQTCAGISGRGSSYGDSGGPLVTINRSKKPLLIGLLSWSYSLGNPGFPIIFTRISSYISWLQSMTQDPLCMVDCQ